MIEDNSHYIKKINEKGILSILIKTEYNKNYKHKLNVFAENWLEVYDILLEKFNFEKDYIINL